MSNTRNCDLNQVDFISSLPDEILLIILSKLRTVEQARTSILSHRWTNLWTFNTHCLTIDAADFIDTKEMVQTKTGCQVMLIQFTNAVDRVLRTHRPETLDQLKLTYPPDPYKIPSDRLKLDSWINIARQKQVKALHLNFKAHAVKISSLASVTFSSLVTLSLKYVLTLSDRIIHRLLSNSPNLLELSIIECRSLDQLRIASSLKLKHLELIGNWIPSLEISAPNLLSFSFDSLMNLPMWPIICFNTITLLTQLSCPLGFIVYAWYMFRDLLPQLVTFTLTLSDKARVGHIPDIPDFPELTNLEQMGVRLLSGGEDDSRLLHLLSGLFKASPRLGRLSLDLQAHKWQHNFREDFPGHKFLKEIEVDNFKGSEHKVQLLICIAESCPSLQKIIIHPGRIKPEPENVESVLKKLAARLPSIFSPALHSSLAMASKSILPHLYQSKTLILIYTFNCKKSFQFSLFCFI